MASIPEYRMTTCTSTLAPSRLTSSRVAMIYQCGKPNVICTIPNGFSEIGYTLYTPRNGMIKDYPQMLCKKGCLLLVLPHYLFMIVSNFWNTILVAIKVRMFSLKWDCLLLMFNHLYPPLSIIKFHQSHGHPLSLTLSIYPMTRSCKLHELIRPTIQNGSTIQELAAWLLIWLICIIIGKSISMKIQKQHHREWVKHMSPISTRFNWHKRPPCENSVADHAVRCSHSPGGIFCRLHSEWLKIYPVPLQAYS